MLGGEITNTEWYKYVVVPACHCLAVRSLCVPGIYK
jgi:hypothetical protein